MYFIFEFLLSQEFTKEKGWKRDFLWPKKYFFLHNIKNWFLVILQDFNIFFRCTAHRGDKLFFTLFILSAIVHNFFVFSVYFLFPSTLFFHHHRNFFVNLCLCVCVCLCTKNDENIWLLFLKPRGDEQTICTLSFHVGGVQFNSRLYFFCFHFHYYYYACTQTREGRKA